MGIGTGVGTGVAVSVGTGVSEATTVAVSDGVDVDLGVAVRVLVAVDVGNAAWFPVTDVPSLAFDHEEILNTGLKRLQGKVRYQPIGFELLPERFTMRQLQRLYEIVLERNLDKRNFRKWVLALEQVEETGEVGTGTAEYSIAPAWPQWKA